MDAEAIKEVQALALRTSDKPLLEGVEYPDGKTHQHRIEPTEHGRKLGTVIEPFRPAKLEVSTLTGFVDAIKAGVIDGDSTKNVVHIEDYLTVAVKSTVCDEFGKRDTRLVAKYQPINAFAFDQFYGDPQKFIIAFQTQFHVNDPDGAYLLKLASNLTAGSEVNVADDGVNQTVKVKAGEVRTLNLDLRPRLKLIPRTTFDEAAPVTREFLIRLKQTPEQTPAIALFQVDGTKWQGENMRAIKDYLHKQLTGWQILA